MPLVGLAVNSIDRTLLVNNVSRLAAAAKALAVPTVLTTIGANVATKLQFCPRSGPSSVTFAFTVERSKEKES